VSLPNISRHEVELLVEQTRRRIFSLDIFRPQPHQDCVFKSQAQSLVVKGGNRGGKTLCASVLFSAIATDSYITLSTGERIRARRPHEIGRPLQMWIMAYDHESVGRVIHAKLFRKGAFKVIRDEVTGDWRSFSYVTDEHRMDEARDADPLIPARYIRPGSWVWEQKAAKIFSKVDIIHPVTKEVLAEIHAFTSKSENPPQGSAASIIYIDEQLYRGGLKELLGRLPDGPNGRLFWSSYPRTAAPELRELCIKAKEYEGNPKPLIEVVTLTTSGNMEIDPEGKKNFLESLTPEERIVRDQGDFLLDGMTLYPLFDPSIHCAYQRCQKCIQDATAQCTCKDGDDKIASVLRNNKGQPPDDWTRELILDPGTTHPGVLFCAIPPPTFGEYLVVYDELYPGKVDARQLATLVKNKVGRHFFNRFIIDFRAGRQTPMGFGHTIMNEYAEAFRGAGLKCVATGSSFSYGSDNVGGRIMELQSTMHLNSAGKPKLRIVNQNCTNLVKQLQNVLRDDVSDNAMDVRPMKGQRIDLHDCLCYWVASRPFWVKPQPRADSGSAVWREAMMIRMLQTEEQAPAWGAIT
jgi:hypothetical protein